MPLLCCLLQFLFSSLVCWYPVVTVDTLSWLYAPLASACQNCAFCTRIHLFHIILETDRSYFLKQLNLRETRRVACGLVTEFTVARWALERFECTVAHLVRNTGMKTKHILASNVIKFLWSSLTSLQIFSEGTASSPARKLWVFKFVPHIFFLGGG